MKAGQSLRLTLGLLLVLFGCLEPIGAYAQNNLLPVKWRIRGGCSAGIWVEGLGSCAASKALWESHAASACHPEMVMDTFTFTVLRRRRYGLPTWGIARLPLDAQLCTLAALRHDSKPDGKWIAFNLVDGLYKVDGFFTERLERTANGWARGQLPDTKQPREYSRGSCPFRRIRTYDGTVSEVGWLPAYRRKEPHRDWPPSP